MAIRVLQVVTKMWRGGLETLLMNYYRHMDREAVQFDFLVHRPERYDFDDEIEAMGGRIYRLPALNPFSISYQKALDRFFDGHSGYKIIHVHLDCMSAVILKAACRHGIPVRISHSHNTDQVRDLKYPVKMLYKRFIPAYATDLMACSAPAGHWMFGNSRFMVLKNAIDARRFAYDREKSQAVRKQLGISDQELVLGHVGRMSPQKNHAFLLNVFSEIQKQVPARLVLVGTGQLRKQIEGWIDALGIREKVILTGSRADVDALMQGMDVFIFPSLFEGLGLTLIEAQAAGLPCLISDTVPDECRITDLVYSENLAVSPGVWAGKALELRKIERRSRYEEVVRAGYDIRQNAALLEDYYLERSAEK